MTALLKSEEWHAQRRGGIGASEAGIVMGVGKDLTPADLWAIKMELREAPDLNDEPRVEWGLRLEDAVAQKFVDMHPEIRVRRATQIRWSPEYPWAFAHLDRVATMANDLRVPLQLKTAGFVGEWGEEGTGDIPHYHLPQAQHEMAVMDAPFALWAVLIGGNDYREYVVYRNEDYIARMMHAEREFWDHVLDAIEPDPINADDVIRRWPKPAGTIEATDENIRDVVRLKEVRKIASQCEAEEKELRDKLALVFGENEKLVAGKSTIATFGPGRRSRLDEKRLRAERPEIATNYTVESCYRSLRTP
jgi:putative phage-type endonuclease